MPTDPPWPTELTVTDRGRALEVTFEDGTLFRLPAELLRVSSPSAEVQGHGPADRRTVAGKREATITSATPVGNYAVKLTFLDGHDTGLYTWRYLHDLGLRQDVIWSAYLAELAAKGLSRD